MDKGFNASLSIGLPVPLPALVVFMIACIQVGAVKQSGSVLFTLLPVFIGFLLIAALLAKALPAGWEITSVVIVFQSLIELPGMLLYLRWLPKTLFS